METETITYRPARPDLGGGHPDEWRANFYLVYRGEELRSKLGVELEAAYDATYYPGVRWVLDDMLARREVAAASDLSDPNSGEPPVDFVIWREGRIMATVHYAYNHWSARPMIQTFEEVDDRGFSNDKGAELPRAGWPTRAEWIADTNGALAGRDNAIILRPFSARLPDGSTRVFQPGEWPAEAKRMAEAANGAVSVN